MHTVSRELALADRVAGASGRAGAHMTIDAFGTPRTFFTYQTRIKIPSENLPFPYATQYERAQVEEEKIDIRNKTGALTFQNGRAGIVLGISPDVFVVIFTQHIIVPVLAFRSKFAIREIEQCAGWWSVWRKIESKVAYRPGK